MAEQTGLAIFLVENQHAFVTGPMTQVRGRSDQAISPGKNNPPSKRLRESAQLCGLQKSNHLRGIPND